MAIECALCRLSVPSYALKEGELSFCCAGCHAVYNVLSARGELSQGGEHPLLREAAVAGLIANPKLLEQLSQKEESVLERHKLYFEVQGLWCPSCSLVIAWILQRREGILRCSVDYATDAACVEYNPRQIGKEEILKAVKTLGYGVDTFEEAEREGQERSLKLRAAISLFFALNVMMLAYPLYATYWDGGGEDFNALFAYLSLAAALPVITYGAWPLYRRFLSSLRTGIFGVETLVVIGVAAATLLSLYQLWQGRAELYLDTATAIIALLLVGKVIESRAKLTARQMLMRLVRTQPRRGRKVLSDATSLFVPINDIAVGDTLKVMAGEKVILDGVVIEGLGSCDEALMTGEALPITKGVGSKLVGGSLMMQGMLLYRVTATAEASVMQKIIAMVERDLSGQRKALPLLDRIVHWFVPSVLLLAAISFAAAIALGAGYSEAFLRSLAVLVIACPCALGIALPLADAQLMQRLGVLGVLVRNRSCLTFLGKETLFIFDKTGTLTHGHYSVKEGLEVLSLWQRGALKGAAALSLHPVAQAIVRSIEEEAIPCDSGQEFPSLGIAATVSGKNFLIGSATFLRQHGIAIDEGNISLEGAPHTICWISQDDVLIAHLLLGDTLRSDALAAVTALLPIPSVLLSGDSATAVASIASSFPFQMHAAECSPLMKREVILAHKERGAIVAMIGDGVNDAPALTAAHVGISMLSASDISIQVSDLMLTTDSLRVLPIACQLARYSRRIAYQNLFWTFFYNLTGLALACLGCLTPLYSAFAMVASSLIVICNAQRISFWKK